MYRNVKLKELMMADLPCITYQKRRKYHTSIKEVKALFRLLNTEIFYDKLKMPIIILNPKLRGYWGICHGYHHGVKRKDRCRIELASKWYCRQWLITVLAHEMVHQYQWDIYGPIRIKRGKEPIMSHGPSFYLFRDKLKKHGIPLREFTDIEKWFEKQDMFKC